MYAPQAGPPAEMRAQRAPQHGCVGVGGGDEPFGLDPRELHQPPSGLHGAPGLLAVESRELRGAQRLRGCPQTPRPVRTAHSPQLLVLEAVLGDRVAQAAALRQPVDQLRGALPKGVQVARGDHQQRHPVHSAVL